MGDRREQRRWQRELEEQLRALPTYDGETPDGGDVTPVGRALPRPPKPPRRRRPRERSGRVSGERRRTVLTVVVTLAVIVGVFAVNGTPVVAAIRGVLGWDGDRGSGVDHAFLATDPISGDPLTWSSCDPISYVVNPAEAPGGWEDLLANAAVEVEEATGIEMIDEGITDDGPDSSRFDRLNRPKPVLVGWVTPEQEPALEGDTVGVAGPQGDANGTYVTGTVMLDGPQFREMRDRGEGDLAQAVIMHELGHLLGLDHVDDERQLMYPTTTFQTTFGDGDLAGLRELGEGGCR